MSVPALAGSGRLIPSALPPRATTTPEGASTAGAGDDDARRSRLSSDAAGGATRVLAGQETYAQALTKALATLAARRAAVLAPGSDALSPAAGAATRVRPEDSYVAYQLGRTSQPEGSGPAQLPSAPKGPVYASAPIAAPTSLDLLA